MDNLNKAVIYKDANNVVQVGFAVSNAYPIEELVNVIVPEGSPFLVVTRDDLPTPPYHNAIVPDFSKPDGISIGADKIRAKWAAEKKAAEEAESERINAEIRAAAERKNAEYAAAKAAAEAAAKDSVEGA